MPHEDQPIIDINAFIKEKHQGVQYKFSGLSTISKVFFALIVVESLVIIGLTLQRMLQPQHGVLSEKYAGLLLLNSVLLSLFAIDGVLTENAFELLAFVFVNISVAFFVVYQFWFAPENTEKVILWIRFISVIVFTPVNVVMAYLVYSNFGWSVYRKIGASFDLIKTYRNYQQFLATLKLDLQISLNFVLVIWLFLFNLTQDLELGLDIPLLVLTLVWAAVGWAAIRQENKAVTAIWLPFGILQPAYIVYKFVRFVLDGTTNFYEPLIYGIGGLSILCRIGLITIAIICRKNYGRGLKSVFRKEDEEEKPILNKLTKNIIHADEPIAD